jgi:sulfur-carrier protein
MQANLYATFRLIAKTKTLTLDLPAGTTVLQAVDAILTHLPELRPHWLNQEGEMHAHVHGFINGKDIATLELGWQTPLQPEDVLDFFPPVAGGKKGRDS